VPAENKVCEDMSYPFTTATVHYVCEDDCCSQGCPGHEVKVTHNKHTSGIAVESEFLPKGNFCIDRSLFDAIIMGDEALNKSREQFIKLVKNP